MPENSLHNVSRQEATHPLMIWIPPFSFLDGYDPKLQLPPRWLRKFPTAIINYRWPGLVPESNSPPANGTESDDPGPKTPLHWPTPVHDVAFGYKWIIDNLAPLDLARRDIYVCGSYLGATLAASLALTETHPHEPMAVRGLVTYNGIYDWTTLLPDHPIHKIRPSDSTSTKPESLASLIRSINRDLAEPEEEEEDPTPFALLRQQAQVLFHSPDNLFDPFASPSLFFHTPALHIPPTFDQPIAPVTSAFSEAVDLLTNPARETDSVPNIYNDPDPVLHAEPNTYNDLDTCNDPGPVPHTEPDSYNDLDTYNDAGIYNNPDPYSGLDFVPHTDPDTFDDLDPEPRATPSSTTSSMLESYLSKPPRKSHLTFPPRKSTLRIPASLLLFDDLPPVATAPSSPEKPKRTRAAFKRWAPRPRDGFKPQASELAKLMIRSVELVELRERMRWDHEFEDSEARTVEAEARVRLAGVGADAKGGAEAALGVFDLNGEGERAVEEWLAERVGY